MSVSVVRAMPGIRKPTLTRFKTLQRNCGLPAPPPLTRQGFSSAGALVLRLRTCKHGSQTNLSDRRGKVIAVGARCIRFPMWPLLAYFALVLVLVTATLVVSYLLGPRHSEPATGDPYEGGIVSEGSARVRFSVRYYLIAAFFVVFDLEAVFLFAWAGAVRELGWPGYCEVLGFVAVLVATLIYLWKIGALDWTRSPRSPR